MRGRAALLFLALTSLLSASACSVSSTPRPFNASVTVTRDSHEDAWIFQYHFERPVEGLIFQRQRSQLRTDHWESLSPGVRVTKANGQEVIFSQLESFTDARFRVRSYFDDSPRDYDFFVPFTDGSAALYTGYLHVLPMNCSTSPGCSPEELRQAPYGDLHFDFVFTPRPGETVVTNDGSHEGPYFWESPLNGSYVYFGALVPREDDSFRAVLDPKLPIWLFHDLQNAVPVLFRFYSDRLGFELSLRPLIFFSFNPNHLQAGYGSSGGVVNQQIQLSVFGDAWQSQSQATSDKIFELMAHEMAHFWNGGLFHSAGDGGDTWMHEGGADAFSYRAMRDLNVIDESEFFRKHRMALVSCEAGLEGIALKDSFKRARIRNFYDCGATIGLITEQAAKLAQHKDLFKFWRELFLAAQGNSNIYTSEMYLTLLRSYDSYAADTVDTLVNHNLRDRDQFFDAVFQHYQLPLVSASYF